MILRTKKKVRQKFTDNGIRRQIGRCGFSRASGFTPCVPDEMIVFSGPTVAPSRSVLEWSRLGNPSQESLWVVDHPERAIKPVELAKQKQVNLSDLANITIEILCRLQLLYHTNKTDGEWVNNLNSFSLFFFFLSIITTYLAFVCFPNDCIRFGNCPM